MASLSSSSYSVPASSSQSCKYDVFLSFRGKDTRKTFVDHFYSALVDRQIRTYKDDETLPWGESINPALFKAIEESQIAVIIFSKNYADSSWCLEELAHIMKCKDERGLIVVPIFYDVDPSEVKEQKGDFGKGFAKQKVKNKTKARSWRKALVAAGAIPGWEPKNIANGHESKVIKQTVDKILDRLFSLTSDVDEDLVGMMARLQDLISLLKIGSGGVRMVGIWGVGGGGKSTLATSVYTEISHRFEGHCIIENIREESINYGLKKLQENILSAIFKTEVKVHSVAEGRSKLKSMLCHRNVLVILDDVNDLGQLGALAGSHNWFGSGSRIIITTRDDHLLRTHKVDEVCPIRLLSDEEAIQLFNKHACNEEVPIKDYETLSLRVVSYAAGLPLALKVLGSFLYDKDEKEWMSALARLKDIPEMEIVEKLKISYDGLKTVEKELFLDIACFLRWKSTKRTHYAMETLEACGFYPRIGIKVLRQKALITIVDGRFDMHDLVQEMGHYIVRGEYPNNLEKHSRVWKDEEISNMCFGDATTENNMIEAIQYNANGHSSHFCKIVSNLKKLRLLRVYDDDVYDDDSDSDEDEDDNYDYDDDDDDDDEDDDEDDDDEDEDDDGKYAEGPNFLSNELQYFFWRHYPASPFPDSFQPIKLVVLKLHFSLQKELWKGQKCLPHLKVLELVFMENLLSTQDFEGLPSLQKLTLYRCDELEEIHPSLGNHRSLEFVVVVCCRKLRMFPTIVQMEKLETLEIVGCNGIIEFPEIQSNMESLVKLSLNRLGIEVLPSSIGERCTNLISLYLDNCSNLKSLEFNIDSLEHLKEFKYRFREPPQSFGKSWLVLHQFPHSLQKLNLSGCCLKDGEIPSDIGELSSLQELNLSQNDFTKLDFSLSQLTRLKLLNLNRCKRLLEFPELPISIAILKADCCNSLTTAGDFYTNFKLLCQVSLIDGTIVNDGGRLLQSMLQGKAIEKHSMLLRLQGLEIAKGFTPRLHAGRRCTLQLPDKWWNDFCGFLMCVVVSRSCSDLGYAKISMVSGMDSQDDVVWKESDSNSYDMITWVGYVSFGSLRHTAWWDQTYNTLSFDIIYPQIQEIKECSGFGVRLVSRKSGSGPTETSTDSSEFSSYKPNFEIRHDSANALEISLSM